MSIDLEALFPRPNGSVVVPTVDLHYACECLQQAMDLIVGRIDARMAIMGYVSLDDACDKLDLEICDSIFVLDQMDDVCCALTRHADRALASG